MTHLFRSVRLSLVFCCFAALGFFSASDLPADGSGLNCDTTIPLSVEWRDYFDQVGNTILFHDDECGMSVPLDYPATVEGQTSVAITLDPAPHQTYLKMYVKAAEAHVGNKSEVTVLALSDGRTESAQPIVEIRLANSNKGGLELILVIHDDVTTHERTLGLARPEGNVITLEVRKSSFSEIDDGFVAVDIGEPNGSEEVISSLEIWDRLPTEASFGVVAIEGFNVDGTLLFQPIEAGYRFFSARPQG